MTVPTDGRMPWVVPPHNGRGGGACSRPPLTRVDAVPDPSSRGPRRLAAAAHRGAGARPRRLRGLLRRRARARGGQRRHPGADVGPADPRRRPSGSACWPGAWLGAAAWPRTPTIVWNVLLLPVGISLTQGNRVLVGWAVIVVALVGIGAAWVARDPDDRGAAGDATCPTEPLGQQDLDLGRLTAGRRRRHARAAGGCRPAASRRAGPRSAAAGFEHAGRTRAGPPRRRCR